MTVAAVQMASGDWELERNIARADRLIREAAARGAQVVLCPELFMCPYFCIDERPQHFELAEEIDRSERLAHFRKLARELEVVLPVGIFERAGPVFYNSVVVYDADGSALGTYRKSHIPDSPGYFEKFYFTPGDTGFRVWQTRFGRIGVAICWDQWFPETARAMALAGADLLCFPSIIGTEPALPGADCTGHWRRTMQGHAAANMVPVVCANRIGTETGLGNAAQAPLSITFHGASFIADESGALVEEADATSETILVRRFNVDEIRRSRSYWGLFRDRRPDLYRSLLTSDGISRNV